LILKTVAQAYVHTGQPIRKILSQLGVAPATYYRWEARAETGQLDDRFAQPYRRSLPPTPEEAQAVCAFALEHPAMGYKRLAWLMVDEDVAYLRPYQVYRILQEANLLMRRPRLVEEELRRPPEPDHPDQLWHIDLMYLYIPPRWYYLVDILDGYSRFLVHWSLNLTLEAHTVTLTVQQALERLDGCHPGEPRLVHDHGSQFLSFEWRSFISSVGLMEIRTRLAHPESNGRLERLHRTHREEGLIGEGLRDYYQAVDAMKRWSWYYNYKRPHSALGYMPPAEYYRGDPKARWAERHRKLAQAAEERRVYWRTHAQGR